MHDQSDERQSETTDLAVTEERREFLRGLGKWSQAVIGGVLLGGALTVSRQANAQWINRRGGWDSGGGSWLNRGGWNNGGGSWINRRGGSWINRDGWNNRGGSWINGGGGWVNRRGGW